MPRAAFLAYPHWFVTKFAPHSSDHRVQKARFKPQSKPPVSLVSNVSTLQLPQSLVEHTQTEVQLQSQTQDESLMIASLSLSGGATKRMNTPPEVDDDTTRPQKKIKVSLAHAVDLAE